MPSRITGTGSCVPEIVMANDDFLHHTFYTKEGEHYEKEIHSIIHKMEQISGIKERRYAKDEQDTIDLAYQAAYEAIASAPISKEELDLIIVAHNFGYMPKGSSQSQLVPNLAAHVKHHLQIKNYRCVAQDLIFGCPGWVQAFIQGHQAIKAGAANHVLVVGVDIISRILDPNDLDVMLFGDGAGAAVLSRDKVEKDNGILSYSTYSHCGEELNFIFMGKRYDKTHDEFKMKMNGRNVYKYAVSTLPQIVTECLAEANVHIKDVSKFLFHQANEKMNIAIGEKLCRMHNVNLPRDRFPMTIQCMGNTSAATIPVMLDLIMKNELDDHEIKKGDVIVIASVGAGMHANCVVYRF